VTTAESVRTPTTKRMRPSSPRSVSIDGLR
jgi:hypothetical protein